MNDWIPPPVLRNVTWTVCVGGLFVGCVPGMMISMNVPSVVTTLILR